MCTANRLTLLYGGDQHNAVKRLDANQGTRAKEKRPGFPVQDGRNPDRLLQGSPPPLASPTRTPPHPADQAPQL